MIVQLKTKMVFFLLTLISKSVTIWLFVDENDDEIFQENFSPKIIFFIILFLSRENPRKGNNANCPISDERYEKKENVELSPKTFLPIVFFCFVFVDWKKEQ